ncbi:MAG TPA: hypothetical protein DCX60_07860 [Phycisphaerales bacterium]|nr:hypothetical protein [Phycisphaerales bacterium]
MKLLIDTCNVLHRTGVLPPEMAGIDEESLASLIRGSRYRNHKSVMICDGNARSLSGGLRGHSKGLIQFKFSGQAQSADTLILELVNRSNSPKRLIVVSSDREIQVLARRRRCRIIDADRFLATLAADHTSGRSERRNARREDPLTDGEVDEWLTQFGVDEATAALPRGGDLRHTEKAKQGREPEEKPEPRFEEQPPPTSEESPRDWSSRISEAEALLDSDDDIERGG